MNINPGGVNVIVGNYGCGKTEVSINLAVHQKRSGTQVKIGDLDLVNPYFRTREAKQALSNFGIDVILPSHQFLQADLPILTPEIYGLIQSPGELSILDVGGDRVGATVLSALAHAFSNQPVHMLQVINPFRPFSNTIDGCLIIRDQIEKASRLSVCGIIGNANLIDETTIETIDEGYEFVCRLCEEAQLPLKWITVPVDLIDQVDLNRYNCPVLPIERQLVPPWKKASVLGPKNFVLS